MTRRAWMDNLKSYRFTRCGTMTADTARKWSSATDFIPPNEHSYARALGISLEEARERISRQIAHQIVEEVQEDFGL